MEFKSRPCAAVKNCDLSGAFVLDLFWVANGLLRVETQGSGGGLSVKGPVRSEMESFRKRSEDFMKARGYWVGEQS